MPVWPKSDLARFAMAAIPTAVILAIAVVILMTLGNRTTIDTVIALVFSVAFSVVVGLFVMWGTRGGEPLTQIHVYPRRGPADNHPADDISDPAEDDSHR